jgi:hypothetical protein
VFLCDGRLEDEKDRDERRWGKSSWETGTWENFVCESNYNLLYSRYEFWSGVWLPRLEVSQFNQASCTADVSYPLVSSTLFSSSYPILLFLVHNSDIITEHKVEFSISVSPCHHHELSLSTAYTEYLRLFVFPWFSWLHVDHWMYLQLLACLPTWSTAIRQHAMRVARSRHRVTFPHLQVN